MKYDLDKVIVLLNRFILYRKENDYINDIFMKCSS